MITIKDQQPGSERQEMLYRAANRVAHLYLDQIVKGVLGTENEDQRDDQWQSAAQDYSAFGEQISGLRKAMKDVAFTKARHPLPVTTTMLLPFNGVEDIQAKGFLVDVLYSRMTSRPGYLDSNLNYQEEAQSMASELGFQEGWQSQQAKGVTLRQSIRGVLQGDLRITHQPRPSQ